MKLSKTLTFPNGTVQQTAASTVPAGIGPNIGMFNPLTSIYLPPGAENTLNMIGANIATTQQGAGGLQRWVWMGASEVRFTPPASNVTSTTAPPMQLARALQRLGLPVADGMATLSDLSNPDSRWASSACTLTALGNGAGLSANGAGSTATYKSLTPKSSVEFWFFDGPTTANVFSYNIDGAGAVNVSFTNTNKPRRITVTGLTSQIHTIVFTQIIAPAGSMFLYGANAYNANDLTVDNWGCSGSGASASQTGVPIWDNTATNNTYDMLPTVIGTAPAVAFVSLGANDYFTTGTLSGFKTALGNVITKLQAAPVPIQVVLVGIYPFTNPAKSPTDLPTAWRQVYYDLADQFSIPLVDLHDRWVDATKAAARGLLGTDTEVGVGYFIHPTPSGHSEIANAMTDLIGPTQASLPLNNFTAGSAPTVSDDNTRGYSVGSEWINTTTNLYYKALSVATGAAVWQLQPAGPFNYANVFGDGSDGAIVFDGSTLHNGYSALSGGTYTLSRDIYATTVVVNTGVTIKPVGYRIFATVSVTGLGTAAITAFGNNGTAAGAGGANSGNGSLGAGQAGAAGGTAAGTIGNGGGMGTGNSGAGGAGSGGAGGGAGTPPTTNANQLTHPQVMLVGAVNFQGTVTALRGGSGGGGGGGDGTNKGGGGGSGGGLIVIIAPTVTWGGSMTATAGAGGSPTTGNCGGGGGGAGGSIFVYTRSAASLGSTTVNGGAGGTKVGTGVNGTGGNNGSVLNFVMV